MYVSLSQCFPDESGVSMSVTSWRVMLLRVRGCGCAGFSYSRVRKALNDRPVGALLSHASRRIRTLEPKWPTAILAQCPELVTSVRLEVNRLPSTLYIPQSLP